MKYVEWNRTGVSRDVLCVGRLAFKFPKLRTWRAFLIGLLANMQERDLSKRGEWPELCPVVFAVWGGWLVVMRRATPLTDAQAEALDPLAILSPDDGRASIPAEPKASSFGVLEGRLVVVDYGDNPN